MITHTSCLLVFLGSPLSTELPHGEDHLAFSTFLSIGGPTFDCGIEYIIVSYLGLRISPSLMLLLLFICYCYIYNRQGLEFPVYAIEMWDFKMCWDGFEEIGRES